MKIGAVMVRSRRGISKGKLNASQWVDLDLPPMSPQATAAQNRAASLRVCAAATGAEDARNLLSALGLISAPAPATPGRDR